MADLLRAIYRRNNDLFRSEFKEERGVVYAVKRFEVNSEDPVDGRKADGLPRDGDPLDEREFPDVVCTSIEYERIGGSNKIDNGSEPATGGWAVWRAEYRSRNGLIGTYIYDGLKYSKEEWQVQQVTLYHGLRPQDRTRRIRNGDGVEVDVGQQVIKVLRYGKVAELGAWWNANRTRIARLVRKQSVNQDAVRLPPLYGLDGPGDDYPAKTLRFHGFRRDFKGGLMELEFTLLYAPIPTPEEPGDADSGWLFSWQPENSKGEATDAPPIAAQIYSYAEFGALW